MADFDPHVPLPVELRELFVSLSGCRDAGCLVPRRPPRYLTEEGPGRPCAPVVPARVVLGGADGER